MVAIKSNQKSFYSLEKAIAQSSHFYFVCLDLQGNYTYMNPYFSSEFLPNEQKIIGQAFDKGVHTEDIDYFQETFIAAILQPEKILAVKLRKMIDEDFHAVNWEFSGITNERNDVIGVQCIGYDDTETYQSKLELEKLQRANAKLNSIMLNADGTYVFLDTNMHVLSFNQKAKEKIKKIFGKDLHVDTHFLQFNQDKAGFIESFGSALRGETVNQEHKVVYMTGEVVWFERRYYPAYDKHNQIIGVVFTSADITKRKKAEQEIIKQNEQLREVAFLQSHLVRRPIVNLLGILELVAKEDLSQENNELIQLLKQSLVDLDNVIHTIVAKTNENILPPIATNERNFTIGRSLQMAS